MARIKNCEELRDHLLEKIEALDKNKIDPEKMGTTSKACETVLSSLKMQLAYSAMRNETPEIEFLQSCNNGKRLEKK